MPRLIFFLIFLLVIGNLISDSIKRPAVVAPSPAPTASRPAVLGQQTKTTGCQVNGPLPDTACTPGAVFPDATKDQVCVAGYTKSVRNVPIALKDQIYVAYGITSRKPGQYEMDHLIPLELGGSNDAANLWPEAAEPTPGFHEKDQVENYLHEQVCSGSMPLQQAQQEIGSNWLNVYNRIK